jgi:hypothetical protein
MSDNEFDQIFSENLKNARSIIDPEEGDWHDLTSTMDFITFYVGLCRLEWNCFT